MQLIKYLNNFLWKKLKKINLLINYKINKIYCCQKYKAISKINLIQFLKTKFKINKLENIIHIIIKM